MAPRGIEVRLRFSRALPTVEQAAKRYVKARDASRAAKEVRRIVFEKTEDDLDCPSTSDHDGEPRDGQFCRDFTHMTESCDACKQREAATSNFWIAANEQRGAMIALNNAVKRAGNEAEAQEG